MTSCKRDRVILKAFRNVAETDFAHIPGTGICKKLVKNAKVVKCVYYHSQKHSSDGHRTGHIRKDALLEAIRLDDSKQPCTKGISSS